MPTVAELSIEVNLKDNGTQAEILRLQQMLQRLATEDPDISVRVSAEAAKREFDDLTERITLLDAQSVFIETDVDAKVALAQLEELQRAMRNLDRSTVNIDVDLDTQGALAHLAAMKVALEEIRKQKVEIDPERSNVKTLNQISAAAQRASGTIRGLTTAIIALGPGLVPLLAVASTGILALAAGFAAAGAGATLFGVVAISAFAPITDVIKKMTAAQKAYDQAVTDKQKETALAKLKALYDSLDPSQRAVVDGFFKLRDAWNKFVAQFRPELFQMAAEGMNAIATFIPHLTPLMQNATKAIHELQTESIQTFQNPVWKEFFQNLTNTAYPAIKSLGRSILNLATGFAGVLNAFFPFSNTLTGGLENLTKKFADWGAGLENNPGFKKFIEYVKENTPKVLDLLKNLVKFIGDLVIAAAPIGTVVVGAVDSLVQAFSKLVDINPILGTIVLAVLALGAIFVNLIGPVLAVVNIVNLLIPLFAGLSSVWGTITTAIGVFLIDWGLLIAAIAAVIAVLVLAYQHFDTFRAKVDALWQKLVEVGQSILNAVKPAFQEVVKFFQDEWTKFLEWWNEHADTFKKAWDNIQKAAEFVLNWLVDEISGALDQILAIWNAIWPGLSTVLSGVWEVIKGVISGAFQVIRGIFTVFASIIAGDWSGIWDGLGDIVFGAINIVWGILSGGFQIILGLLQILWAGVQAAWEGIKNAFINGATASVEFLKSTWNGIVSFFQFLWDGIVAGAQNFVNVIVGFFQWLWDVLVGNSIVPDMVNAIIGWWNTLLSMVSSITSAIANFVIGIFTTIWNTAVSIWNAIVSAIQSAITTAQSIISSVLSAISSLWNSIWSAVSAFASSIWATIKSIISAAIESVRSTISNVLSAISSLWNSIWSGVSSFASSIWSTIKSTVSNAIETVRSTISNVLSTIKSLWETTWNNFVSAVKTAASNIMAAIRQIVSDITGAFTGLISQAYNWGANIVGGLVNGIKSMAGKAKDAMGSVISGIASVLPGSPAETGPLSGQGYVKLRGERFMEDLTSALKDTSGLQMTMRDVVDIMALRADPTEAYNRITSSVAGAFQPTTAGSSTNVNVAAGAVVLQLEAGVDPEKARKAFEGSADTLGEALLTAIQKR